MLAAAASHAEVNSAARLFGELDSVEPERYIHPIVLVCHMD